MTNGNSHGIRRVLSGLVRQVEEYTDHVLNLGLVRPSIADYCLFYCHRGVLEYRETSMDRRKDYYAPGMTKEQSAPDIYRLKNALHC